MQHQLMQMSVSLLINRLFEPQRQVLAINVKRLRCSYLVGIIFATFCISVKWNIFKKKKKKKKFQMLRKLRLISLQTLGDKPKHLMNWSRREIKSEGEGTFCFIPGATEMRVLYKILWAIYPTSVKIFKCEKVQRFEESVGFIAEVIRQPILRIWLWECTLRWLID